MSTSTSTLSRTPSPTVTPTVTPMSHPVDRPLPELRLTRRGRLVVLAFGLAVVFAIGLLFSTVSFASDDTTGFPTRVVMVAPGDTLWDIADDAAGSASTRDMVTTILDLNDISGGGVQAGQRLVVPLR